MVLDRLRARDEWKFFGVLPKADRPLAVVWWALLLLRGVLPALFAVAMGVLVGAVQRGDSADRAALDRRRRVRAAAGHFAAASGDRQEPRQPHGGVALRRTDRAPACVRPAWATSKIRASPPTSRWRAISTSASAARRSRSRWTSSAPGSSSSSPGSPPRCCSPRTRGGRRCCSAARGSRRNGCCAKARCGATATPTRYVRRSVTPTTRIGSPSIRRPPRSCACSGLSTWTVERFTTQRRRLFDLRWEATRLRERPVVWSLLIVLAANVAVFVSIALGVNAGRIDLGAGGHVRERGRDHQHDRVRRIVVGARRRRRTGRRGAAAAAGDGSAGRAGARHRARRGTCRPARSVSATSRSPIRPAAARCSTASI